MIEEEERARRIIATRKRVFMEMYVYVYVYVKRDLR